MPGSALTLPEVAVLLKVAKETAYTTVRSGQILAFKVPGQGRLKHNDLGGWRDEQTASAKRAASGRVARMSELSVEETILNSPYAYPGRRYELNPDGQPTNRIQDNWRRSDPIIPVPKTKRQRRNAKQGALLPGANDDLSMTDQECTPTPVNG